MLRGRDWATKQIDDAFKVVVFARANNPKYNTVLQQLEICQNFADFHGYEVVGIATEIETLLNAGLEYDGVLVTKHDRLTRDATEYQRIKQKLLEQGKIIITAVRSF